MNKLLYILICFCYVLKLDAQDLVDFNAVASCNNNENGIINIIFNGEDFEENWSFPLNLEYTFTNTEENIDFNIDDYNVVIDNLEAGKYEFTLYLDDYCFLDFTVLIAELAPVKIQDEITIGDDCESLCLDATITGGSEVYTVTWYKFVNEWIPFTGWPKTNLNGNDGQEDICGNIKTDIKIVVEDPQCGIFEKVYYASDFENYNALQGRIILIEYSNESACSDDPFTFQSHACDGILEVDAGSNVSYKWSTGSTNKKISNLCVGEYTVTVTDNISGCQNSETYTICCCLPEQDGYLEDNPFNELGVCFNGGANNQPPEIVNVTLTEPTDEFSNDGEIRIVVHNTNYYTQYIWSGPDQLSNSLNQINLGYGEYCVTVTDGCLSTNQCYTLDDCSENQFEVTTDFDCFVLDPSGKPIDGEVRLDIKGGSGNYNVQWSNGLTGLTNRPTDPGTYNITITDDEGCSSEEEIVIQTISTGLVVEIIPDADNNCDENRILLTAEVTGGNPPYSYSWETGETTSSIYYLGDDKFAKVTVTDQCDNISTDVINADCSDCNWNNLFYPEEDCECIDYCNNPDVGQSFPFDWNGSNIVISSGGASITACDMCPEYTFTWPDGSTTILYWDNDSQKYRRQGKRKYKITEPGLYPVTLERSDEVCVYEFELEFGEPQALTLPSTHPLPWSNVETTYRAYVGTNCSIDCFDPSNTNEENNWSDIEYSSHNWFVYSPQNQFFPCTRGGTITYQTCHWIDPDGPAPGQVVFQNRVFVVPETQNVTILPNFINICDNSSVICLFTAGLVNGLPSDLPVLVEACNVDKNEDEITLEDELEDECPYGAVPLSGGTVGFCETYWGCLDETGEYIEQSIYVSGQIAQCKRPDSYFPSPTYSIYNYCIDPCEIDFENPVEEYLPSGSPALEGLYNCTCEVTFNDPELEDRMEVESLDNIELEIYPNPTSNLLTLNILTDQIEININVYDLNGKEIFRKNNIIVQNGVYNLEITVGEVASGFYIVKVGNENVTRNAKFIKN